MMTTAATTLQAWLALEHEAVWFYPVVGARFDSQAERAATSFEVHRITRDRVLDRLAGLGVEPEPARLAYGLPPASATLARRAARDLEARIAAVCLTLAGDTADSLRRLGLRELRRAALADLAWGGEPEAFPGLA